MANSQIPARLVRRGDVIEVQLPTPVGNEAVIEEVVRSVDIIIHLANGTDVVVPPTQLLGLIPQEELPEELQAIIDSIRAEEGTEEG